MPYRLTLNVIPAYLLALAAGSVQAADIQLLLVGPQEGEVYAQLLPVGERQWQAEPLQRIRGESALRFTDVAPGNYAVQLFVDRNGNGTLDLSPRGRPLEPVGLSGNPPLVNGVPPIETASFSHADQPLQLIIRLRQPPAKAAARTPD
jgi:hypothetical protein